MDEKKLKEVLLNLVQNQDVLKHGINSHIHDSEGVAKRTVYHAVQTNDSVPYQYIEEEDIDKIFKKRKVKK